MGQALYRKYRSKKLSEVVGQEHITKTLTNALKNKKISHAYLFTGPRGVGKTSIARILAHEINNLPYNEDENHIDIIEIDAASNRRIDEIRELRESAYIAPTSSVYKVYIIDEVHMLTTEAFNALLKLLEEPPAHVVFILATTDSHKLPDTIISRTQRYSFKPASIDDIVRVLRKIAKSEQITVPDDVLKLIAEHGSGSFRDSIGLLDQASNQSDNLTEQGLQELLGIPATQVIESLYESLSDDSTSNFVITLLNDLLGQGYQSAIIAKSLGKLIRDRLIKNQFQGSDQQALALLSDLILVSASSEPDRSLEIAILKYKLQSGSKPRQSNSVESAKEIHNVIQKQEISMPPQEHSDVEQIPVVPKNNSKDLVKEIDTVVASTTNKTSSNISNQPLDEFWPKALAALKQKYNTLYGIVRMAQPSVLPDNGVELQFKFAFHQKRVMEAKNQHILRTILKEITGQDYQITCVTNAASKIEVPTQEKESVTTNPQEGTDFLAISNIFGGGELLES